MKSTQEDGKVPATGESAGGARSGSGHEPGRAANQRCPKPLSVGAYLKRRRGNGSAIRLIVAARPFTPDTFYFHEFWDDGSCYEAELQVRTLKSWGREISEQDAHELMPILSHHSSASGAASTSTTTRSRCSGSFS